MAYNIKQITNYDIKDNKITTYSVNLPLRTYDKKEQKYKVIFATTSVKYQTALEGISAIKLGYCCEEKGIPYPIYLQVNGSYKPFIISKKGMYEIQPEQWENMNEENSEEKTSNIIITGVRVPQGINFTLDYVIII